MNPSETRFRVLSPSIFRSEDVCGLFVSAYDQTFRIKDQILSFFRFYIRIINLKVNASPSLTALHLDVPTFSSPTAVNYSPTSDTFVSFALLHSREAGIGTEVDSHHKP